MPTVVLGGLLVYGLAILPERLAPRAAGQPRDRGRRASSGGGACATCSGGRARSSSPTRSACRWASASSCSSTSPDVIHSFWVPVARRQDGHDPGPRHAARARADAHRASSAACAPSTAARRTRCMAFSVVVMEPRRRSTRWLDAQARAGRRADRRARGSAARRLFVAQRLQRLSHDPRHRRGRTRRPGSDARRQPPAPRRRHAAERAGGARRGGSQHTDRIKPGVHMPAFRALRRDDLSALAAYLERSAVSEPDPERRARPRRARCPARAGRAPAEGLGDAEGLALLVVGQQPARRRLVHGGGVRLLPLRRRARAADAHPARRSRTTTSCRPSATTRSSRSTAP